MDQRKIIPATFPRKNQPVCGTNGTHPTASCAGLQQPFAKKALRQIMH
jgi:hypothetical protein